MKKKLTIQLDDQYYQIFKSEAEKDNITLSEFLERAGLLYLLSVSNNTANISQLSPSVDSKPKKAGRKPKINMPKEQSEFIYTQFIEYLNNYLSQNRISYTWRFEIAEGSITSWLPSHLFKGESLQETNELLSLLSDKLLFSLKQQDEQLCFEAIRLIMDWGGVYYNFSHGLQRGNETAVIQLLETHQLLSTIKRNHDYILNNKLGKLDYYTSGWGIVWFCLAPDKMVIMGSREIYALNKIILKFQQEFQYDLLPSSITLGQLVYQKNRRCIDGISYVYTKSGKLKMLQKYLKIINSVLLLGSFDSNIIVDELLFMLGEI